MPEFPGAVAPLPYLRAEIPGRSAAAYYLPTVGVKLFVNDPAALAPPISGTGVDAAQEPAETSVGFLGSVAFSSTPGRDFYEKFHVLPRRIDLGNILSTTTTQVEIFSAFRRDTKNWVAFDNNAGDGVSILSMPTLPQAYAPMTGRLFSLQVTLNGPAVVDTTLDYTFNDTGLIPVPITFKRVILLFFPPEQPYEEILEWLTDVLPSVDGTEQRVSVRKNPRQLFSWELYVDDGFDRSLLENALFDWQSRSFGLPQWHEATPLNAAVTAGVTTTLTVVSTADADYRDGELLLLYESPIKYDVLNLVSHTATTLVLQNPPTNSYTPLADLVLAAPLRLGVIVSDPTGARYYSGHDRFRARFRVKDNDANIGDASAYPTFNSKILLDDFNFADGTMPESLRMEVYIQDGGAGVTTETTRWDRHRRGSQKRFAVGTKADLWKVRKLLHFLRGRQLSFYLPTFSSDLQPLATMTSGASTLAIRNVGYTNFVRSRQPKNVIRVVPATGLGSPFLRTVASSTISDATQENITITTTWPSTLTTAQIQRIEFVEKVRMDSDAIRISHRRGNARYIDVPVRAVLE
jgi:hypothetical protein